MIRVYVCINSLKEGKPPVVVREDLGPEQYFHRVAIHGPSEVKSSPQGAHGDGQGPHVWIETWANLSCFPNPQVTDPDQMILGLDKPATTG